MAFISENCRLHSLRVHSPWLWPQQSREGDHDTGWLRRLDRTPQYYWPQKHIMTSMYGRFTFDREISAKMLPKWCRYMQGYMHFTLHLFPDMMVSWAALTFELHIEIMPWTSRVIVSWSKLSKHSTFPQLSQFLVGQFGSSRNASFCLKVCFAAELQAIQAKGAREKDDRNRS